MKSPEMFVKNWLQNIKPLLSMDSIQSPTSSEELIATSSTQPSTVELVPSGLSQSSEATHKQNVLQRKKDLNEIVTELGVEDVSKHFIGNIFLLELWCDLYIYILIGQFKLPVTCLVQPNLKCQIHSPDLHFVKCLHKERLKNPTLDVAPLVALVILPSKENFNPAHAETYKYETIGGNHSRIVLQEIIKDESCAHLHDIFSHHLVSVYHGLMDEQAQHICHRHNRATEFTNKMITQDKALCHIYLHFHNNK